MIYGYWFEVLGDEPGTLPGFDLAALEKKCGEVVHDTLKNAGDTLKERARLLKLLKEGDVLVVPTLPRFAQSMDDLLAVMERLLAAKAAFEDMETPLCDVCRGGVTPRVMSAAQAFQRAVMRAAAQREAAVVRARGRNGGRPKVDEASIRRALRLYDKNQLSIKGITEKTGVSKSTLYKYISQRRSSLEAGK